jgi:hypothetical protein
MAIYFGQLIAEKLTQADAYYAVGNHINAHDWAKLTDDDKKAGLLQSEREVNLYLGTDLETNYSNTDWPESSNPNFRPDYAIFEDARFILENTVRTKEGTDGARRIESEEYQEEEKDQGVGLSPQAQRFLRLNRTQISRG